MKKITFNALLNHKAHNYKPMQIEVEKVIPLYGKRFEQMKNHPLDDCPEIIENRDLMYMKGNTAHCILFLDANGSDGILVEAEGSDYARKSQFIPNVQEQIANKYIADVLHINKIPMVPRFVRCIKLPPRKKTMILVTSIHILTFVMNLNKQKNAIRLSLWFITH